MRTRPAARAKILTSLVIGGVLLLQAQAVFPVRRLWPFLDYPMYRTAHYAGESVPRYRVVGIAADGREVEMDPASLGLSFFKHLHGPVEALETGDAERFAIFADVFRERQGTTIVAARLENHPVVIDTSGTREGDLVVVTELRLPGEGAAR
jgi:hypothetical protein